MMIARQTVFFSRTIRTRLIHGTAIFNCLNEGKIKALKQTKLFDPEGVIELSSNTLIKPFLNLDKTHLLKQYCHPHSEVISTYSFVINERVAKDIVDKIIASRKHKEGIIVEGNPGLGLITINLINSGVPQIFVFDNSELQEVALTQLISRHKGKITKKSKNINKSLDAVLLSALDIGRNFGAPVTIIGVTTSFYFLKGLVFNFVKYKLWPDGFEVFLVLSKDVWKGIKESKRHFKFHFYCMFHILFTAEEVAKYPRDAFLPLSDENSNSEDMHLIRFSLNPNAFDILEKEELEEYFDFLKILSPRLSDFVIAVLEKWLPDCGPYFISKGVSMTTQIRDLSYKEAILLFSFLKECEGYSDFKSLFTVAKN